MYSVNQRVTMTCYSSHFAHNERLRNLEKDSCLSQCVIIKINPFLLSISDEGIDKEIFLNLEDTNINVLIPKIGPRVKFKRRLKEYLQVRFSTYILSFETLSWAWTSVLILNRIFLQRNVQKKGMQHIDCRITTGMCYLTRLLNLNIVVYFCTK